MNISIGKMLIFFSEQQKRGYHGINYILAMMDTDELPDAEKIKELNHVLEDFGLTDELEEHIDSSSNDLDPMSEIHFDELWDTPGYGLEYNTRLYSCGILNGVIWFDRCLN